jgi:hypothetical protein
LENICRILRAQLPEIIVARRHGPTPVAAAGAVSASDPLLHVL